jgi:hypothetical protein
MRTVGAATGGEIVHLLRKGAVTSSRGVGKSGGAVVGAVNKHRAKELTPGIGLARTNSDLGRFHESILAGDHHRAIQRIAFRDHEGRDKLLGAGDLAGCVGIFLVERASCVCVN